VAERVLVVNAGSSSLKLSIIERGTDTPVASSTIDGWLSHDADRIEAFVRGQPVDAVGHRVVHGGALFTGPAIVDEVTREAIASLTPLAPLHQPRALAGIDASRKVLPEVPQVACFDTTFHVTLPPAAATYAIPERWRTQWDLRRFGFHGLSHRWGAHRAAQLLDRSVGSLATVVCHLGSGASLCAVAGGTSVDTTMGFTPVEGLVMGTRSGTVDPGIVLWLLRNGMSIDEVEDGLERHGGLLALADTSDMRDLLARRDRGDTRAQAALDVYLHRLCREAAGMVAALGRLDAVVFTGGVGERAPTVRAAVIERLAFLGLRVDPVRNARATGDQVISPDGAEVATVVVTSREDLEIAAQVRGALGHEGPTVRASGG
jgi:acetate kinase